MGSLKSFTLTIPWKLASPVINYPGIIVRQHHTDRNRMGLLREQCVEFRKGHLRYCCNPAWMKNGGRTPWNVSVIFEIFKISCLMGGHHMRGGSEYHLMARLYRLEQWSSITLSLQRTYRDYINSVLKSCQVHSLHMRCTRCLERRHVGRRH